MFSKNSHGSFDERPEDEAEQFFFCLPFFIAKILERLLHGFRELLPELLRIVFEELPVERMSCGMFTQSCVAF